MRFQRPGCGPLIATLTSLAALLGSLSPIVAADFYLTPSGSGEKTGASWDSAFDQKSLKQVAGERLMPGDRLLLGGGEYPNATLVLARGGSNGSPISIVGVDRGQGLPMFVSKWNVDLPTKGSTALRIEPGVSHVHIQHLRIKGCTFGVNAPPAKDSVGRTQLVFDDVDIEQFRYGFYMSDCDDLRFVDCDLKRYTKHGFRLDQGCDRVNFVRCTADCSEGDGSWEDKTELLPFGFTANDGGGAPNTAVRFEDCLARNNMKPNQTNRYKNGDGFVVEGNSADVAFVRCRSIRNQDGGFDLKVADVRLTDCLAIGNKRGFRIWTTGTLTNCFAGWNLTDLWNNGGPVTATRCTFYGAQRLAVMTDDESKLPITLQDCLISVLPADKDARATSGKVVLNATIVTGPKQADKDPDFLHPDAKWDGVGDAMNSRTYPDKGYHGGK